MDREAKIKLIAEGASRAQAETNRTADAVGNIGTKAGLASGALQELGRVAFRIASDAARAFNDVRPIEFGRAGDQARQFSDQIARYAQRFGADANVMRSQVMQVGESIGATSDRVAGFARSLSEITSTDAAGAVRDLGEYANQTGRELEEVTEIGGTLMAKLGVPVDKVGESLQRLRDIAQDFSTVGGSIALEKTLLRAAPMVAQMAGGLSKNMAVIGALTKGQAPEVAAETAQGYFAAFAQADPALMTRKTRQLLHDPTYQPYTVDTATGRLQLKEEVPQILMPAFRKAARPALYQFFGGGMRGVSIAERLLRADMGAATEHQKRTEEIQRALVGEGAVDISKLTPSQIARIREQGFQEFGGAAPGKTEAERIRAQRARVDAARQNVELEAGEVVQQQRDKRNALYEGNRKAQAAVDTLKTYMPSTAERVTDIVESVGVEAITEHKAGRSAVPTVELGAKSIENMARAVSRSPIIAKPDQSSSSKAVEDSKAKNRGGANY